MICYFYHYKIGWLTLKYSLFLYKSLWLLNYVSSSNLHLISSHDVLLEKKLPLILKFINEDRLSYNHHILIKSYKCFTVYKGETSTAFVYFWIAIKLISSI